LAIWYNLLKKTLRELKRKSAMSELDLQSEQAAICDGKWIFFAIVALGNKKMI
jgi:hypothetical protein